MTSGSTVYAAWERAGKALAAVLGFYPPGSYVRYTLEGSNTVRTNTVRTGLVYKRGERADKPLIVDVEEQSRRGPGSQPNVIDPIDRALTIEGPAAEPPAARHIHFSAIWA